MKKVSQQLFNQGLLLAARAAGAPNRFTYKGSKWDAAFDAVADLAKDSEQIASWWIPYKDPVGNCYSAADELIVQGEHDLLLGLLGSRAAVFLNSPEIARSELEKEFPHVDWLKALGKALADGLNKAV